MKHFCASVGSKWLDTRCVVSIVGHGGLGVGVSAVCGDKAEIDEKNSVFYGRVVSKDVFRAVW